MDKVWGWVYIFPEFVKPLLVLRALCTSLPVARWYELKRSNEYSCHICLSIDHPQYTIISSMDQQDQVTSDEVRPKHVYSIDRILGVCSSSESNKHAEGKINNNNK